MQTLDKHICELLYEHDCVIVPSLGGFLASNVQAKLNPGQHSILPPRRKIAFNIYLRQNDGLLANHLVEYERLTYPEAIRRIEEYVQDCFSKLDLHRKVIVERVGTIYYDREKHLLFEPFRQTQFRKDSYGLSSVQFLPVERNNTGDKIEQQRRELMKPRPSIKSARGIISNKKLNYKVLGLFAIAGTLLWFSFNLFLLKPGGGYLSSINPFAQDTNLPEINTVTPIESFEKETVPEVQKAETVFVASTEPVMADPQIEKPVETENLALAETKKITTVEINTPKESEHFHVVAGAFKISENADAFLVTLKEKGFSETHIIRKGSLNYVSYGSFSDRASAVAMLDSLRKRQTEGWIWHN